ncbi:hypothetical protein ACVW0J_004143 [Bradyrhizobium sp. i1.7.7]
MSFGFKAIAAAALSIATLATSGLAQAADLPVKAAKKASDVPFFLVIDNRVTFSWMPKGTDPGMWSVNPNGSINGTTAKQVYSFTHFDLWAYGTNFFTISMFKSGHNDPASPCIAPGSVLLLRCSRLRRRDRDLRPIPLDLRLEPALQHQGLHHGAAAEHLV